MRLLTRFDQRILLPGESETRASQRRLASALLLIAAFANIPLILHLLNIGLTGTALSFLLLTVAFFIIFALSYALPAWYEVWFIVCLLTILVTNVAGNYYAGGYTSGFEFFIWVLTVPVWVALFGGRRAMIWLTIAYIASVVAAGLLEPAARAQLSDISPAVATAQATFNFIFMGLIILGSGLYLFNRVEQYRRRADDLLLNILPAPIAARLKLSSETIADGYDDVTVLFADIVDFTPLSAAADPVAVVQKLNAIFSDFDVLAARHGLEKIKTIGDAYMVAGGLPEPRAGHCRAVAAFAVEMVDVLARHVAWDGEPLRIRVGINCGPVVAGVIGRQKFIYDLWGDVVNVASRMESYGLSNQIQVTEAVKERLEGLYHFEARGPIEIKGKGPMRTYLLQPR
ncbi:MAG: adenylate/guanylate cyclase domain-containing protein [Candidatus Promineifilaceae bacterium]